MADSANVESAIGKMLGAAFYPFGTSQPSIIGSTIAMERGWPTESQVQNAVATKAALISIHADKGMARDTTRYFRDFHGCAGVATITATLSGLTITFAGTIAVGHAIAVQCAGVWFPYLVQAGDTATTIAAAFAALIPNATASGAVLTLPSGGAAPQVRVVMGGTASAEVSRQRAVFRISCWAPTPELRDQVFAQLPGIVAFAGSRLTLPDGSIATWMGQSETGPDDIPARANEWRRDVLATYEFGVLYTIQAMAMLLLEVVVTAVGTVTDAGDVAYPTSVWTDDNGDPLVDAAGNLLSAF
jgi:hypothetical protein